MQSASQALYGIGRLAFGGALVVAPEGLGRLLLGDEAREPAVRAGLRSYGTRDVVLGLGVLRAIAGRRDVAPWLAAGVAADVLDAAVQITEWSDLPADRRAGGVLAALGAAGAGVALLAVCKRPDISAG